MQDKLIDVVRLQREHGGILETIGAFLDALDKPSVATTDALREIAGCLTDLHSNLCEYVHFGEYEALPRLRRYSAGILSSGLVLEYENILASISKLIEQSRDLADGSSDEVVWGLFEAKLREKMQEIRWLVKSHARKQELILELAYRTLERETGQNSQT